MPVAVFIGVNNNALLISRTCRSQLNNKSINQMFSVLKSSG